MTSPGVLFVELENLRHRWGWFLLLGIILICLGTIALLMTPVGTVAAVLVLGWLMVASGVIEIIHGFRMHGWGGIFLHLIGGLVGGVIWLLIVTLPLTLVRMVDLLFVAL